MGVAEKVAVAAKAAAEKVEAAEKVVAEKVAKYAAVNSTLIWSILFHACSSSPRCVLTSKPPSRCLVSAKEKSPVSLSSQYLQPSISDTRSN